MELVEISLQKFKDYNAVIILGGLVGDPITKKYKLLMNGYYNKC